MDLSPFAMEMIRNATVAHNLTVECVAGDLTNPSVCPGPFDVVVERRTIQLFDDVARDDALVAVTARLAPRGLFVTPDNQRSSIGNGESRSSLGWWP